MEVKSSLKDIGDAVVKNRSGHSGLVVKNGCGHSGLRTLKLTLKLYFKKE